VTSGYIFFLITLAGSLLLDGTVRPRRSGGWRWQGILVHLLVEAGTFGLFLACLGNSPLAMISAVGVTALLTVTSNAKFAMLGEPLIFSDFALLAAVVRHPRFYLTAISSGQRRILLIVPPILLVAFALLFVPRLQPHLVGLGLVIGAAVGLPLLFKSPAYARVAQTPDIGTDLPGLGLIPTLLLYWWRWRVTSDPKPCPVSSSPGRSDAAPYIVVLVQCESFADPVELTGEAGHALAGLARARASAWQWGDLNVSGFGAYTMRTEYGVLFGRSDAALGFRRYDPFLTAHGETSYALSARLRHYGYRSLFVHPHDMRFYGRDRLMPAIGFERLIGEESFAPIPPGGGRYIDDVTLGAALGNLIDEAVEPTLIYAVTMENHGPWDVDQCTGSSGGIDAYLRHLRSSDDMLTGLIDRLSDTGQPALLVFFGDHRPSIPGVTEPGGDRHTPYVMLRFSADGRTVAGPNRRVDLMPDQLHHAILDGVQSGNHAIPSESATPDIRADTAGSGLP
jgi:hypothetical protein